MIPGVHCMHDPTEGGLANALFEVSEASNLGFSVREDFIMKNTLESTKRICSFLKVNPLNLISSGSLLITIDEKNVTDLIRELGKYNISAYPVGRMMKRSSNLPTNAIENDYLIENGKGELTPLRRPITDELWKALEDLESLKLELAKQKESTN